MLLLRTDAGMGSGTTAVPVEQSAVGRERLCVAGGSAEPVVSADRFLKAIPPDEVERFRPLLPVGYAATAAAYRQAVAQIGVAELTDHYTVGLNWFHHEFVPRLKTRLTDLSGGVCRFRAY